jgi:uncharacterized protein involved in oxidation of intracellular sulfur
MQVTIFLMADAVLAGKAQQKTPDGYYNIEPMLKPVLSNKGVVLLCGTCTDARGISGTELMTVHVVAPWTSLPGDSRSR